MSRKVKTVMVFIISSFFILSAILNPVFGTVSSSKKEIHLLRVEHYLVLEADDYVGFFNVSYAFPSDYKYQTPVYLEILNDTTSKLIDYEIVNYSHGLNKIVNFTLEGIDKDERCLIHFSVYTLVENNDFSNLPDFVEIPKKDELSEDVKIWLKSSPMVQLDNFFIRMKADCLNLFSEGLVDYAKNVAFFIKNHRYLCFVFQLNLGLFLSQDAVTTLFINGECVGRSHLGCALLRSQNIPSRVLLVNNDQGFWTQMHYMVEYYVPGYGWVLMDPTYGKTPYQTKRQVINRICYPEDEYDTKEDYIFPFMDGEEKWIWISDKNVNPFYIDCEKGSKSKMFKEQVVLTDPEISNKSFKLTRGVFGRYQKYLGCNISGENLNFFNNATFFQRKAIENLKENDSLTGYRQFLNKAYLEYQKIDLN